MWPGQSWLSSSAKVWQWRRGSLDVCGVDSRSERLEGLETNGSSNEFFGLDFGLRVQCCGRDH